MNEKMRESLSALMDDEANELELERVLAHIDDDEELRRTWTRFNIARDAVDAGVDPAHMELDISRRVQAALKESGDDVKQTASVGMRERFARPLASFAVAASVAATVVLGGQQLAQLDVGTELTEGDLATISSTPRVGIENSYVTARQASQTLHPVTPVAYRELARLRMERFMQEHAEHAALNSPQGLVPFARVPTIQE